MKRPPRNLRPLVSVISRFNGLIAVWNSSGYTGKPPNDLIETIAEINDVSATYLNNYKGNENA